jgi:hypothetical protein
MFIKDATAQFAYLFGRRVLEALHLVGFVAIFGSNPERGAPKQQVVFLANLLSRAVSINQVDRKKKNLRRKTKVLVRPDDKINEA